MSENVQQPTDDGTKPRRGGWLLVTLVGVGAFFVGLVVGLVANVAGDGGDEPTVAETSASQPTPTAEPVAEEPSPSMPQIDITFPEPGPEDFDLTVKTLGKECFGSAGCNVTFRIEVGYGGPPLDSRKTYEVTYEVSGGEDPLINTLTVTGEEASVDDEEFLGTANENDVLVAEVTDVSEY